MDTLLPGHAHRSSSDRLLNNYLSSQKQLSTALLTLLSHSHSSSSSLLAYVTSSPGVPYNVRRAVQHAAFEGPLESSPYEDESGGSRWNNYLASLETFRKELKDVHTLEEELSQVKRDREILIGRLIKATKSRPSKSDIAALASASAASSVNGGRTRRGYTSSASTLSLDSENSQTTAGGTPGKRSKRAAKLAEAQAEVLGCEEHLRGLEVQLEVERTKVMKHGLMERFRAMEDVARMWLRQSRAGMNELERANGRDLDGMANPNAYELDSNGSLAPSQSASQVGVNPAAADHQGTPLKSAPQGGPVRREQRNGLGGSVTGSIAEEDEDGSSGSEDAVGNLVVHENRPAVGARELASSSDATITRGMPSTAAGVPSITQMPAPRRTGSADSFHGVAQPRRRVQSEVGMGYKSPTAARRHSLRRTFSGGHNSDASSIRSARKKGGFFKSIARLFKSQPADTGRGASSSKRNHRRGDESPPLTSRTAGGWHTRTDDNLRKVGSIGGERGHGRSRDESSDSEDELQGGGGFVAVSNLGNNRWSVDKVGVPNHATGKATRSDLGSKARSDSTSTITPAGKGTKKATAAGGPSVGRSNTVGGTPSSKRTRQGSISRGPGRAGGSGVNAPSIHSVIEKGSPVSRSSTLTGQRKGGTARTSAAAAAAATSPPPPRLMEVPKAPRSQVTPEIFTVSAPPRVSESLLQSPPPLTTSVSASALASPVRPSPIARSSSTNAASPKSLSLGKPITANGAVDSGSDEDVRNRPTTPLPPSKSLSPPLKSSLRSPSPMPSYIVSAPGSVVQDPKPDDHKPAPVAATAEMDKVIEEEPAPRPTIQSRDSYAATDSESIYESAAEDAGSDDEGFKSKPAGIAGGAPAAAASIDDTSSEASDDTADPSKYRVIENTRGEPLVPVEDVITSEPSTPIGEAPEPKAEDTPVAPAPASEAGLERRKSVRMAVPDSPALPDSPQSPKRANGHADSGSTWTSRIGTHHDSSDEEDNSAYAKAKRSLSNSTKRFSGLGQSPVKSPKSKKRPNA